jgi:hypothetical protein
MLMVIRVWFAISHIPGTLDDIFFGIVCRGHGDDQRNPFGTKNRAQLELGNGETCVYV